MAHWSDKYIGRPYIVGEYDCAELAMEVARVEFGLPIDLPTAHAIGVRAQTEQIAACQSDFATRILAPVDGDPVLMQCRGRFSHIGVLCIIEGEPWVLHAMQNAGMVVRHKTRDIDKFNLAIEGYYRWKV